MRMLRGFVLAFHDIPPQRLCEFVEAMRPAKAVSLSELVDRSKQGRSTSGLFAITVDDGVGETVRTLAEVFQSHGWPGTFYLATQYLDSGEAMPFQYIRQLLPWLPKRRIELRDQVYDLSAANALQKLEKDMERMWHVERRDKYVPLTLELAEIAMRENGLTISDLGLPAPITWQEVADLSRTDTIRFESHGVSHAAMSTLTEEELIFEMRHSQKRVSEHTGRPCRHLAYPFGSEQSIGPLAATLAPQYYESAVTMSLGHVDSANPWLLPRIPLYSKNSKLTAWLKLLLKCSSGNAFGRLPQEVPAEVEQSHSAAQRRGSHI